MGSQYEGKRLPALVKQLCELIRHCLDTCESEEQYLEIVLRTFDILYSFSTGTLLLSKRCYVMVTRQFNLYKNHNRMTIYFSINLLTALASNRNARTHAGPQYPVVPGLHDDRKDVYQLQVVKSFGTNHVCWVVALANCENTFDGSGLRFGLRFGWPSLNNILTRQSVLAFVEIIKSAHSFSCTSRHFFVELSTISLTQAFRIIAAMLFATSRS